jgi:hypothetical protein
MKACRKFEGELPDTLRVKVHHMAVYKSACIIDKARRTRCESRYTGTGFTSHGGPPLCLLRS